MRGREWTPADDAIVRGFSTADAAEKLGRTRHAVWKRRSQLGVTANRQSRKGKRARCRFCSRVTRAKGMCHAHYQRWEQLDRPPLETWDGAGRNTPRSCTECGNKCVAWSGVCRACRKKATTLVVFLPADETARVRQIAAERQQSPTRLIRDALASYLM